jgi:hypothetical protein
MNVYIAEYVGMLVGKDYAYAYKWICTRGDGQVRSENVAHE